MFITNAYAENDVITIQDTAVTPDSPAAIDTNWIISILPMFAIVGVIYFFLIRPQEKRRRAQEALVDTVKKGEEVLTSSGIFGVVSKINDSDNTVWLEIADATEIKILKSTIVDIVSRTKKIENNNQASNDSASHKNRKNFISHKKKINRAKNI